MGMGMGGPSSPPMGMGGGFGGSPMGFDDFKGPPPEPRAPSPESRQSAISPPRTDRGCGWALRFCALSRARASL
jgi:hypothetical protein